MINNWFKPRKTNRTMNRIFAEQWCVRELGGKREREGGAAGGRVGEQVSALL
jgi:hypothetical protein